MRAYAAMEALQKEMTGWRQDLHAHPEFGFEERRTASLIATKLREFGLDDVAEGVGGTGVVGTLRRGIGNRAIALRADMDALRINEQGTPSYRSQTPGLMHACGHDGHTAMLLGAAKMLAAEGGFDGVVRFIFQPAEEWGRGAQAMLEGGLLSRFPFDEIYGLHNWPGLAVGSLATRPGPLMAAEDNFEIKLSGRSVHAARPHQGRDALVAACATVLSLQTLVSRVLDPTETAVVSVTELLTDGTRNVLPGNVRILGDCRSFRPEISSEIEASMRRIAEGVAGAHGCEVELTYTREFVPLVNDPEATQTALSVAKAVFGPENVKADCAPIAASEDFARFLAHAPGCFVFIGNGMESRPLHNPHFDFNDEALVHGARFHVELARHRLPKPDTVQTH
ncbi:MAG: M20 aminoacylase family protein [Blastocatellia bacterium]